jgi:hypothetical protein
MAGLFEQIKAPVTDVVKWLLSDKHLRKDITYKRYDSAAFDDSVGYRVTQYTDFVIGAIRMRHNKESAAISESEVEVGEELFLIDADGAPDNMSLKDQIIDEDGNLLQVRGVTDIFGLAVMVDYSGSKQQLPDPDL